MAIHIQYKHEEFSFDTDSLRRLRSAFEALDGVTGRPSRTAEPCACARCRFEEAARFILREVPHFEDFDY